MISFVINQPPFTLFIIYKCGFSYNCIFLIIIYIHNFLLFLSKQIVIHSALVTDMAEIYMI